ncbi:MAG: hypothetical protein OFPII_01050 [Osedax symbiont Rs1]|nr:MAG: hypothetical protein OFPII_01050 [Osedax symbiont Rs1]
MQLPVVQGVVISYLEGYYRPCRQRFIIDKIYLLIAVRFI